MAEPIDFRILQHLQAALQAVSVARGYHYDVAALTVKLDPNQSVEDLLGELAPRPFYVLEVGDDEFAYMPAMRVKVTTPITIHAIHESDPTDDNSWWLTWSRLCADVEQAVAQDISRGGLATDTRVLGRSFHTFGGQQVWAKVSAQIATIRSYGLPNG